MSSLLLRGAPLALLMATTSALAVTPISEGVPVDPAAAADAQWSRFLEFARKLEIANSIFKARSH